MTDQFDEFSKALAEKSVPRRQSLRLLGAALAGAILGPLGVKSAWAANADRCKAFCKCRNRQQQDACLAACRNCFGDTSRLCGTCGSYVCCAEPGPYEYGACVDGQCTYWCVEGAVDCGGFCTSLADDPYNCGACGNICSGTTPYCTDGVCTGGGDCAPWETRCGTVCVDTYSDENNCGGCGIVCPSDNACLSGLCVNVNQPPPTGY